ncbi:hypothetical protein [Poseidonocella sp. HB161398]|uniref:hypothetical protein n=1 Tax=Poseidonocella sp. HB161398 TaxID=2320855 RepID=UPI0011097F95|nr:hypothetical protein [Poseidonocella sp. HB161398]
MMTQISIGLALRTQPAAGEAAPPEPEITWIATAGEFSRDQVIFDSGAQLGLAAAPVPLSGSTDAPDGTAIEARAVAAEAGGQATGWRQVGTAQGGAWSGSFVLPRSTAWMRIQTRPAGSTKIRAMAARCAAGHVWAVWEQSNWNRIQDYDSSMEDQLLPVARPGDMQVVKRDGQGGAVFVPVSTDEFVSPAVSDMANAFSVMRPGEKLCILFHTQSGTSPQDALTMVEEDAEYGTEGIRDWAVEAQIHALGTQDGQAVGMVFCAGWIAFNAGAASTPNVIANYFLGHNMAGGATTPVAQGLPRLMPAGQGGLYDYGYTRFAWAGPHGRAKSLPAAAAIADASQLPGYAVTADTEYDGMIAALAAGMGAAENPETLPYIGPTSGAERDPADTAHMTKSTPEGRQRLARIGLHNMLQTLGLAPTALPVLDQRWDVPDGSAAYFGISGRDLSTERLRQGLPAIPGLEAHGGPAASHRTEVMGFAINTAPAQTAEIHAVTAAEVAAGCPMAEGQKVARVLPNAGVFTYADNIVYGPGALPGYQVEEDYADRACLNWLVADMGQPQELLPALPVQHMAGVALPSTLTAPQQFAVAGGTVFNDPDTIGSGRTAMRARVVGKVTGSPNIHGLANAYVTNFELRFDNGAFVLMHNGTALSTAADYAKDVVYEVVGLVDIAAARTAIWVDGTLVAEDAAAPVAPFATGRKAQFLARSGGANKAWGTFSSLELWFSDPEGAGAPYKTVAGTAAAVNADPWKTGDDAA